MAEKISTSDINIFTQRYLESIETKAKYEGKEEARKDEITRLYIQNIVLFIVVGYIAAK